MKIRRAELKDLRSIQELNNELFELELNNFDKYLIKDWPLSDAGREYFQNAIKDDVVFVACDQDQVIGYILGGGIDIPYYNF